MLGITVLLPLLQMLLDLFETHYLLCVEYLGMLDGKLKTFQFFFFLPRKVSNFVQLTQNFFSTKNNEIISLLDI